MSDYRRTLENIGNAARKGELVSAVRENAEEHKTRRRTMVLNIRDLCKQKGFTNENFTLKKFALLIKEHPDKFYNLKSANAILQTYFVVSFTIFTMLKEMVFDGMPSEKNTSSENQE